MVGECMVYTYYHLYLLSLFNSIFDDFTLIECFDLFNWNYYSFKVPVKSIYNLDWSCLQL